MPLTPLCRRAPAAVPCLLFAAALSAHAQPHAPPAPRPDPLDAAAAVPAVRYVSPLAQPTRAASPPPIGWREANEAVARIGGWRAYAREAQQPAPAQPAAPAASAPQATHGHHGKGRQP